ncbi:MAG: FG-GAP-like repeat-containing protein, partial [Planctomycetota bacterium]|nr:FG-GAP-like repeat-containing protein [Planctomycetota bacterium]
MSTRIAHFRRDTQTWAVLVALVFALAACGGGSGTGLGADGPPAAPTAGYVPVSSTNPQNVINQNNQSDLWVHVEFGPESRSNTTVTITLGEPTGDFVTAEATAPEGGGSTKVGPMNARALPDGPHSILAEVTGPGGSSGQINLGTILKDTVFYSTPVASSVAAWPSGPQPNGTAMANVINLVNVGSTTVTTVWAADSDDSLSFVVEISDNTGNTVTSAALSAPEGAGTVDANNIDTSGLDEGPATVTVFVTDPGGNQAAFVGTPATKDVTVPSPATVHVAQGGSNPEGFINAASQTSVTVRAVLNNAFTTEDTLSIELTDGSTSVTVGPSPVLMPEGPNTFEMDFTDIDASAFTEGPIALNTYVEDTSGNRISFSGTAPTKDTIIGQAIATFVSQGLHNPPGIINIASEAQVYVDVTCDAQTAQNDGVTAHFETAGIQAYSSPTSANGPGMVSVGPTNTEALYDGNITVWATITDAAGNTWTGATSVADKGTAAPTAPSFVRIASGSMNGVDVVNSFNVSSATVETQAGSGNDASRSMTFVATDGVTTLTQTVTAPNGGSAISFAGLDLGALKNGSFGLQCWATDGFANQSDIANATPFKDSVAPAPVTNISIASGPFNPQGFINASSAAAARIDLEFPTPYEQGVYWQIACTDSVGASASSSTFKSEVAGGSQSITMDLSGLADGSITVTWSATDTAGNPTSYTDPSAIKDTMVPGAPSSLTVQAGTSNAASVINMHSETGVRVAATFGSGALGGGEQFSVTLTPQGSSSPAVSYGPISGGPIGGTSFVFGPMNTTSISDGSVDIRLDVMDPAGNAASYLGTTATKDVVPPAMPTSAVVAGGPTNPANFINATTTGSVQVDVGFGSGTIATDQVTVTLTGSAFVSTTAPATAPSSSGSMSFSGINTTNMFDGPVTVSVNVEDVNQNTATYTGIPATKDTIAAGSPANAFVATSGSNPQGYINGTTAPTTLVSVAFPDSYEGDVTWRCVLTDTGASNAASAWVAIAESGSSGAVQVNAAALADGSVTVSVEVVDEAGNPAAFPSWTATKDTIGSGAPTSVGIAVGPSNPANVINENSVASTRVQASFPPTALSGGEQYTVTLTPQGQSSPSVTYGPIAGAAAGGSTFTFGPMDATVIPDGSVDVSIEVEDAAGNPATFAGTIGTKDVTAPGTATVAGVLGSTMSPANFINFHNEPSIDVGVTLGSASVNTDQVWVMLTGGAFNVTAGPMSAPSGSGSLSFAGMDGSLLADGPVSVQITVEDANGNQSIFDGTQALKDTIAPSVPTSASVAPGATNDAHFINLTNLNNVVIAVDLPSDYRGLEQVTVTLAGGASISHSILAPTYGGTIQIGHINAAALSDGAVTISVDVMDPAGNSVNFTGTPCFKDTTPPAGPTSIAIPVGASNPANVINNQTDTAVDVVVNYDASMTGTETAILSLTDSSSDLPVVASFGPTAVPAGGGMATFSGINAGRLADGAITLTLHITDGQHNGATFTGTPATKDTVGSPAPLTAHVWTTPANPTNFINAGSQGAVQVDVGFDAGSTTTDTVTVTLGGAVNSASMTAPAGVGTLSFTGIDASSLPQGDVLVQVSVLDASMNLTSMFGTTARKDTVLPDPYTSAHIVAGPGNPQDIVNTNNASNARMFLTLPNTYLGSEIIDVSITDSASTTASVTGRVAPFHGGVLVIDWPNLSTLLDGTLTVSMTATDPAGNQGVFATGTNPTKDTAKPFAPSSIGVPMSAANPADFINAQTVTSVSCTVTYDGSMDGTEIATLVYTGARLSGDENMERRFGPFSVPASGGAASISGSNLSGFADGMISISLEITDVAGNTGVYAGTSATKDTVAPNDAVVDPMPTPVNVTGQLVTGVADPATNVEVIVSGTPAATATSDALGSFVINWSVPTGGTTAFEVRATDDAGNPQTLDTSTDWNGATLSVTHDATAPSIPWTDNTVTANVGDAGSVSGGSFVDVDNDGDLDLFVGETNRLWKNDGSGVYTDVTATAAPGGFAGNEAATWGDYDGDGDLDLWTTDTVNGSTLWQNDGAGNFVDVTGTATAAVSGAPQGASWLDYNADGWNDLFAVDTSMSGHELLSNGGLSGFSPVPGTPLGIGVAAPRWVCVGDLDGNGMMDVVIGDSAPSMQYMNNGSGAFTDMAGVGQSGFSSDTSTSNGGITMADLDNDGDLDIFVASGGAGGANQFWQNDGAGNFVDVAATAGCDTAANAYDVVIADFDNDGMRDIYLACNGDNVLYRNLGDQVGGDGIPEFTNVAAAAGGTVNDGSDGRLCCAGDVDGDGDMDVFVGNEAVTNVMYQNDLGNNFRYLMVKLLGKGAAMGGSSPDAIGAKVHIEDAATGADVMWHWVGSGRGAGADDPKALHFGGLTPSRAYHVHVTWPTGATQTMMNVVPTTKTSQ